VPQLVAGDFAPQLVWLAITFVALYLMLSRVALPRIAAVLEARAKRIADDLDRAQSARDEAAKALAAYEAVLGTARRSAQDAIQTARRAMAERAAQRQAAQGVELAKQIAEAEGRIAAARDQALSNVAQVATDVARSAVDRLIGQAVDPQTAAAAVAAALKGRG
jgi:F-type H+-transporting ATPase subunit b